MNTYNPQNIAILIDFDNLFYHDLSLVDNVSGLQHEINNIINIAYSINFNLNNFHIRFYGGWMEKGILTNYASRLLTTIENLDYFPFFNELTKKVVHGQVELATHLVAVSDFEWQNTRKTKLGIPNLRLVNSGLPPGCKRTSDTCPVRILHRFSKKPSRECPVPGCNIKNEEAFMVVEQKMVDTMLACDIMEISNNSNYSGLIVASDDMDLLPPLAQAIRGQGRTVQDIVLVKKSQSTQLYHDIDRLSQLGLTIKYWRH